MGKYFIIFIFLFEFAFSQTINDFDWSKVYREAKKKNISERDVKGYVNYLYNDYLSHKNSNSNIDTFNLGTIYKGGINTNISGKPSSPNSPQNTYCPNAGFEQLNFGNWTGDYGIAVTNTAVGASSPTYSLVTSGIVNSAGNNTSLVNTLNYHTIMTTPPISNLYPFCVGYDSIACKLVGAQLVSQIPVVNPNGGPASVRINGAMSLYRACRLNYNMSLNPNNKSFSVSYAIVLEDGGHVPSEQAFFMVKITDQNGNLVPGCSIYSVTVNNALTDPNSSSYDSSWIPSNLLASAVFYKKWNTFNFDMSNYPLITSVNIEFIVSGCALSGHYGYAYVDADCAVGGANTSFCSGSNTAILSAPSGYTTYQWISPTGPISSLNGGSTPSATVSPAIVGTTYTCIASSQNGCVTSFQTTINTSTVNITGVSSTPSCANGTSGAASVNAIGSSMSYNYLWQNNSGVVGTTQNISGLSSGIYSITVSSALCGSQTTTVSVGISPINFINMPAPYCGTTNAWINANPGTNYNWYSTNPLNLMSGVTTSSLQINTPINGTKYIVTYNNINGCKDSIIYTLTTQNGGYIEVTNVENVCSGNSNGSAIVNLVTIAPPVYNYTVTGAGGYSSILNNSTFIQDTVHNLSIGVYTVSAFDGQCIYSSTFNVFPINISYTLSPQNTIICGMDTTLLLCDFGNPIQSLNCGPSVSSTCNSSNSFQIGNGNIKNTVFLPAIYAGGFDNARHQILYKASELLNAGVLPGKITSLSFEIDSIAGTMTYHDFSIRMKCTNEQDLTTPVFDSINLTQVFFSNSIGPISIGWNTYNFTTPYIWDGVSNILVDICFNNYPGILTTSNSINKFTLTPFNSIRYNNQWNPNGSVCDFSAVAQSGANPANLFARYRPNVKIGNCPYIDPNLFTYNWTPTLGLSTINTYSTIANPTISTIYTVEVSPIGQTNCIQTQSSTITIQTIIQPTITVAGPYCDNFIPQQLSANPVGGFWSTNNTGTSIISDGTFTPSLSIIGNNTIFYTLVNAPCTPTKDSITINVIKFIPATLTATLNPCCVYDAATNLQAIAQNMGGVWSGNGVSGSVFTPSVAGIGNSILTYSTNPAPIGLCPDTQTMSILVNPKPEANAVPDNTGGCNYPWKVNFMTTSVNTGTAIWDFGDGKTATGLHVDNMYTIPGTYTATLYYTDNNGCKDTTKASSTVTIYPVPIADFESSLDVTTIIDAEILFTNYTSNLIDNTYTWNFGDLGISAEVNPIYLFTSTGDFFITLIAVNNHNCRDTVMKKITINPDFALYVPNAFTPDRDGLNDGFKVFTSSEAAITDFSLVIYNRWGELIYSTTNVTDYWNGAKNNTGDIEKQDVYAWKVSFKNQNKQHEKVGHVTLLKKQ